MKKTMVELRQMCRDQNIPGFSAKKKCDLVNMLTGVSAFTEKECQRSADEWFGKAPSPARSWFYHAVQDPNQHRDIGKVLAYLAEEYVNQHISRKSGRPIISVYGKSYDGVTADRPEIRHQVKFRKGPWHLETTRRNSRKNQDMNQTGHIAYRPDEFDVLVIFIPGPAFGITGSQVRLIPTKELIHPSKPGQLITNADKLKGRFHNDAAADAVIQTFYKNDFTKCVYEN